MVDNSYEGTCSVSVGKRRPGAITASLDGGPPVPLADKAKFEFANISRGVHTLSLASGGAPFEAGGRVWNCPISVVPGGAYTVLITCADDGAISSACPSTQ
jgi:hypothetical protein